MPPKTVAEKAADAAVILADKNKAFALIKNTVKELEVTGWDIFESTVRRVARRHQWDASLLTIGPVQNRGNETMKERHDRENFFDLILDKVGKYEHLLEDVQDNEANEAFQILHENFHRTTTAGFQQASLNFNGLSMEKEDVNISEFIAEVSKRAKRLARLNGTAGDIEKVSVLLSGLLPEFRDIKTYLNNHSLGGGNALTFKAAAKAITDFSKTEGLDQTRRGGSTLANKTYTMQEMKAFVGEAIKGIHDKATSRQDGGSACRNWEKYGNCGFGDMCKFGHKGKGDHNKHKCDKCNKNHKTRFHRDERSSTDTPRVHFAKDNELPLHVPAASTFVFAAEAQEDYGPHSDSWFAEHVRLQEAADCGHDSFHDSAENPVLPRGETSTSGCTSSKSSIQSSTITFYLLLTLFMGLVLDTCSDFAQGALKLIQGKRSVLLLLVLLFAGVCMATQEDEFIRPPPDDYNVFVHAAQSCPTVLASSYHNSTELLGHDWMSDSGTNRHVTNDKADFIESTIVYTNTKVGVGGGTVQSPCFGTVAILSETTGKTIFLTRTLLITQCAKKLIAASPFVRKGCSLTISNLDQIKLQDPDDNPLLHGKEIDGLYYYAATTIKPAAANNARALNKSYFSLSAEGTTSFGEQLLLAHRCYGHCNFDVLRKILGLKPSKDNPECAECAIAKSRQRGLSQQRHTRSPRAHHRYHVDLGFTKGCQHVFQLAIDCHTRKGFIDFLPSKGDTLKSFSELHHQRSNQCAPYKVAFVRTDDERVYNSQAWEQWFTLNGVVHEISARYRQGQNGVVERAMQTIGNPARAMMLYANAPESEMPDALRHANTCRNNFPTKANAGRTPNEMEAGIKLSPSKYLLRAPLFCLVYAHVYKDERRKHEPRAIPGVYCGYDDVSGVFKLKDWATGRKYFTADVTFHVKVFPYRANPPRSLLQSRRRSVYQDHAPYVSIESADTTRPQRHRQLSDKALQNIAHVVQAPANVFKPFGPDPSSLDEAMSSKYAVEWSAALLDELNQMKELKVWELVPREDIRGKIFKPKLVFKIKLNSPTAENPHGTLDKFRARLTIAAFTRILKEGVDYEEKYASTVHWNSMRNMLAIAAHHDLDITLFDIKTFFLYGEIPDGERVYMEQLKGYEEPGKEDWVCKLKRGMYGYPPASNYAQQKLKASLTATQRFMPCVADDCVFRMLDEQGKPITPGVASNDFVMAGTHVDDICAIGTKTGIAKVENLIAKDFKYTKKPDPDHVTQVQIIRDRNHRWLKLHQRPFIDELLDFWKLSDCHPADTPMEPSVPSTPWEPNSDKEGEMTLLARKEFMSIVGSLMWLLKTRPDIAFAVNFLARRLRTAGVRERKWATRVMRYLAGTRDWGIAYLAGKDPKLNGAADADFAGCVKTSRSTSGNYLKYGDYGTVVYRSWLERKVADSTGHAETHSTHSLCKQVQWNRVLQEELGVPVRYPVELKVDNQGVVKQAKKAINHTSAKHYRVAQAVIRDDTANKLIEVPYVHTSENPSDMFTKALPRESFERHRAVVMGPQVSPS